MQSNLVEYRIATALDLESVWDKDIMKHSGDDRWVRWKGEYIQYNKLGQAKTFVAVKDRDVIAQVTLILSGEVKAVSGRELLCNDYDIANFNAFRCDKEYQKQGHISKLVKIAENWARDNNIKTITIGVEANQPQNMCIYFHFGYTSFVMYEFDKSENELILYYSKQL